MGQYSFREIHLEYEQWENIPRLIMVVSFSLTPRQRQVMSLYLRKYTQTKIARFCSSS